MLWEPAVEHHVVPLMEGDLHFVERGKGSPCVLVHGAHGSWTHWIANVEHLAQTNRVIAIDLPGFGCSYTPSRPYGIADFSKAVAEVIQELSLEEAAVVGFSFGGIVAASVAAAEPAKVKKLALVNPSGLGPSPPEVNALQKQISSIAREQSLKEGVAQSLKRLLLADAGKVTEQLIDLTENNVERARSSTRGLARNVQLLAILQQLCQPVLVLLSSEDQRHPGDAIRRRDLIKQTSASVEVQIVPAAGHWLQVEVPEIFNSAVASFLSRG